MATKPKPAAREPLSRERIEHAALDVIERDGLAGFSIRKLAADLHCEAMSIYHYFPSKTHILDALVDRVVAEIPAPPRDGPWIDRVAAAARAWRTVMTKRPALFIYLSTHRMNTRICLRWLDDTIGLFMDGGLTREDAVRSFRSFGYYLVGAGLDETAGYARGPSTAEPVSAETMQLDYPNVVSAAPYFQQHEWDATFEAGLAMLLAGLEAKTSKGRER